MATIATSSPARTGPRQAGTPRNGPPFALADCWTGCGGSSGGWAARRRRVEKARLKRRFLYHATHPATAGRKSRLPKLTGRAVAAATRPPCNRVRGSPGRRPAMTGRQVGGTQSLETDPLHLAADLAAWAGGRGNVEDPSAGVEIAHLVFGQVHHVVDGLGLRIVRRGHDRIVGRA